MRRCRERQDAKRSVERWWDRQAGARGGKAWVAEDADGEGVLETGDGEADYRRKHAFKAGHGQGVRSPAWASLVSELPTFCPVWAWFFTWAIVFMVGCARATRCGSQQDGSPSSEEVLADIQGQKEAGRDAQEEAVHRGGGRDWMRQDHAAWTGSESILATIS